MSQQEIAPPPEGCLRYFLLGLCVINPIPVGIIVGILYYSKPDPANRDFGKKALMASTVLFTISCVLLCLLVAIPAIGGLLAALGAFLAQLFGG